MKHHVYIACTNTRHSVKHIVPYTMCIVAMLIVASLLFPPFISAQESTPENESALSTEWLEWTTEKFVILYTPGNESIAQGYASFVDTIYEDVTTVFSYPIETPITLRLYPSYESYTAVNPLAPKLTGIVAHADFRHREVAVLLSATEQQSPEEVHNNVRHELTHIIVSQLSDNRLNTGFQEGIAQYMEQHVPNIDTKIQLLKLAREQGTLLEWSAFDDRQRVYGTPEISYPQTLSVVAFLIEQHGFGTFRNFLTMSARSSGYRSALERAYEVSPTDLEAAWLEWLPSYLEGGYRRNVLSSYDLSHARQLFEQGRYADAQQELQQAIAWLQSNQHNETSIESLDATRAEAETLLNRSQEGLQAEELATQARTALEEADYARAIELIQQSRSLYAKLGDTRQERVLQIYAERAERGLQARKQLDEAITLAHELQYSQARDVSESAAAEFAELGDTSQFDKALELRHSLDSRQRLAGMVFVALGIMGVGFSMWGRLVMHEEEAW